MHHQFVASALATKICHEIIPDSQVGCMITKLTYYPYSCKPEDVLETQKRMRSIYAYSDTQVLSLIHILCMPVATINGRIADRTVNATKPSLSYKNRIAAVKIWPTL